jgi:A/G-specific adenine glycosylase
MADRAAGDVNELAARRLRAPLLRWYRREKRDLPWRRTTDPYAIWVSEVMLQQTTVAAVIPYWERFLDRFPDAAALAKSREEDVLALWSGLGYYRRARALRDGAIAVMERHGGRVPDEPHALIGLPGIGRYTMGAISSLAFGRETPVVDGNVKRVFSRLFAIRGAVGAAAERRYWAIAGSLVRGTHPGDWNQAVMELGATVCTPRTPRCDVCPLARWCRAYALGHPTSFPAPVKREPSRVVPVAVLWLERRGRVLLQRAEPGGPLRGAWDLPATSITAGETPGRAIAAALAARHGVRLRPGRVVLRAKHSILATRLAIEVVEAAPTKAFPRRAALRWVALARLDETAISGATKKIAQAVLAQRSG